MSQSRINLAILIDIRSYNPRTGDVVKVEHTTFTDIDEQADILLTSFDPVSRAQEGMRIDESSVRTSTYVAVHLQ